MQKCSCVYSKVETLMLAEMFIHIAIQNFTTYTELRTAENFLCWMFNHFNEVCNNIWLKFIVLAQCPARHLS